MKKQQRRTPKKRKKNNLSNFDAYITELWSIQKEYGGFKIVKKQNSVFSWTIRIFLWIISFGQLDYFNFYSVIGKTLHTGLKWDNLTWLEKFLILKHERKHLEQMKRCFFGVFWPGCIIFSILYIFFPLPILLTSRGFWFEKEAYQVTIIESKKLNIEPDINRMAELFCGPKYIWMFPFKKTVVNWLKNSKL